VNGRATLANLAWFAINAGGYRRFRESLDRVQDVQDSILERYLRHNQDTAFGRRFEFSGIRSAYDYQERVPLSTYDDYRVYVERIARGESGVLTREPVRLLEPSSGSTSAAKWIPYTSSLQAEIRAAVAPWLFDLFLGNPDLLRGPAYWSITPALRRPGDSSTTVPIGFEADSAYLGGAFARLAGATLAVPGSVRAIEDMQAFRRVTLLFLLKRGNLRLISIWHPTFLTLLLESLQTLWDDLLACIESGFRMQYPPIDIPADRTRARELSSIGPTHPSRLWPNLRLISCWGDGHAQIHLGELRSRFPGVEIQAKGLIATEAFVSLPFQQAKPLAIASHFLEFLDSDGRPHFAWDLEDGGEYSVAVTTGGGLYRYQLHDRIKVTGFLKQTPCIRFLGKEDRVSDLFGEKLSEGFVAEGIARALADVGVEPRFVMLAPETSGDSSKYLLLLEAEGKPPDDLASALETILCENPNYEYCVRVGQLAPLEVVHVREGASRRYIERLAQRGQRLGDVKPTPLSPLTGWRQVLC
jgi:hypothetical protein